MALPEDVAVDDIEATSFLVTWSYPTADQVLPTEFHVNVFGQSVGTVEFAGVGEAYQLQVDGRQCGTTHFVQIVAVNGDVTESSETVQAATGPC